MHECLLLCYKNESNLICQFPFHSPKGKFFIYLFFDVLCGYTLVHKVSCFYELLHNIEFNDWVKTKPTT
jgi:hypothetical protein